MVLQTFGLPIGESEIQRAFEWSTVRRLFCCIVTATSGWQRIAVVSEEKEKEVKRDRRVESEAYTWKRGERKPEQGVIMTHVIGSLWFCPCVF